jgi:copper chaperone CopZ
MSRTVTLHVEGMHCASCSILVDDCMEDVEGVVSSTTDLRSGRCTVEVDDTVPVDALVAAVAEAGYAGTVLA